MQITMHTKGESSVLAYETKVLLIAIADIVCKAENMKEVYNSVKKMANAEGVVLKSFEEAKAELKEDREQK